MGLSRFHPTLFAVFATLFLNSVPLPFGQHVDAASFDCDQASLNVEKAICADSTLSQFDIRLGQLYAGLLVELSASEQKPVKQAQRAWLSKRNRCSDNPCIADLYTERLAELNQHYQQALYAGKDVEVTSAIEQTYDNAASIVIRFSVPVERNADFRRYLTISSPGVKLDAANWLINDDGFLAVYPFIEPQTQYEVQIKPGLQAINGRSHAANRSFTITSRRSEPSAAFASSGQVMSAQMKRALPVVTLNVDEVDVDFFHIASEAIPEWSRYNANQRVYYSQLNAFTKANPLVYSARFPIEHQRNQRTTTNLDLGDIPALEKTGAYLAVLRIPGNYQYNLQTNFFTVSDVGIQVRRTINSMHVLSNDITSGKPFAEVTIALFKGKELLASQITDKDGIATFSNWFKDANVLLATSGDSYTLLRLDKPLDLSGISNPRARHQNIQVFAWGPRDLYRPGELFETFAILRDYDGRQMRDTPVSVGLLSASGSSVVKTTLNRATDGSYHFNHQLPDSAKTGRWKLVYRNPATNEILTEYEFSVEDFLPERMKLALYDGDQTSRRLFYDPAEHKIPVAGDYLYGAPAAGNQVDGFLVAEVDRHPFDNWKTFSFGIDMEKISNPRLQLAKITLDAEGKSEWTVPLNRWRDVSSPLALTTTASLYESGGRPVTRSFSATRITQTALIGIEPQFDKRADNNSRAGFKLILTDAQGQPRSGNYQYGLVREDRNYYWTYSEDRGWSWHYDPMEYESFSGRLSFAGDSPLSINVPVQWGNYRLEVRDSSNEVVSSYRFRTRWYWWGNNQGGNALKPDQVNMSFRDESYQSGETARLLLSPATAGLATITVEDNDKVLWVSQRDVEATKMEIEIPIDEAWSRHDIYVTATILSPGDMTHSVAPKRAFGFVNLPLRRADAAFAVSIDLPDKIEPETRVSATVEVEAGGSIPDNTWVTLAAVDVGVLNITRYETPDPVGYLYGPRRYEADYFDIYGQIIENAGYDYSQHRFGGGFAQSMAELSRGGDKPKSDVHIVALQTAPVRVDSSGRATIEIDIPQFNGKLRWMAVAYSNQTFGSSEAETTVADKLVTQLSRPRFMALGDDSELTLDLSNLSGQAQRLTVSMKVAGALDKQEWTQTLDLADSAKQTLRFPITATGVGEGRIELDVDNGLDGSDNISLGRDWLLGVRYAYPAVTRKQMSVINPGETWDPKIGLEDLVEDSVQGQLILSSQPPIDVNSHFEQLLRYPYGCTEQTTSSGYPWVLVDLDAAQRMQLMPIIERRFKTEYTETFRKQQIETAIKRITPRQGSSGGFALWNRGGKELSWLSVYVTDFLTDAELAGAEVDRQVLNAALNRLNAFIRGQASTTSRWTRDANYYNFASRAYAAYVLAKVNRGNLSDLRRLYQSADGKFADSPLPWAHLAYALDRKGDATRAASAYEQARKLRHVGNYIGYYDSTLRDLALTYAILASRGEARSDMLMNIFKLTKERRWLSTQERNALFKAALASQTSAGERLIALIQTKTFEQNVDQKQAFKTILDFDQIDSLDSIKGDNATVFASLEVIGNRAGAPEPYGQGFTIRRDYFNTDGKRIDLGSIEVGELVVVRISVRASAFTPDALVVDLLPAGLELENQNLANASVDLSKVVIDGQQMVGWRNQADVEHVEYRDDRFVAAMAADQYNSKDLFYLARAVTPGSYRVPPPYVEDMYRPYNHAVGETVERLTVTR